MKKLPNAVKWLIILVVLGAMGAEHRMDFTVIGDAVNLGARLCSAAEAGIVLASQQTVDAAGDTSLAFTAREPIQVKGKKEPIAIHEVRSS